LLASPAPARPPLADGPRACSVKLPIALAICVAACGDSGGAPDAGIDPDRPPRLTIVSPGDSIGLPLGASIELRVRYTTHQEEPIDGAVVDFALVAGAAGSGGSAISAASAPTDEAGEAAVSFLAGAETVDLRVIADAPGAQATFYINVSSSGFAEVAVTPSYAGGRGPEELARVELRLYRESAFGCDELDVEAPPDSPIAPRTLATWGEVATWPAVAAGEAYTLLVWGVHAASERPVSAACVDVPVLAPTRAELALAVPDLALAPAPQALVAGLDLSPLDAALEARGAHRPWQILACPSGRGQLLLDWLIDALSGDGSLDGETDTPTGHGAAMAERRAPLDQAGCRAGAGTLDEVLDAALDGPGLPGGGALALLLARRRELFDGLAVESELDWLDATAATHRLVTATLDAAGAPEVVLAETSRPVLTAALTGGPLEPGPVALGSHGFTLRTGALLRDAFEVLALGPVALEDRAPSLGAALVEAGGGCGAIDALACDAIEAAPGCAEAACQAAAFALDGALATWFRAADGPALDLTWAGNALVADLDGDLVADPIEAGTWEATLTLIDGEEVDVVGAMSGGAQLPE
jgi:hypothetical protein